MKSIDDAIKHCEEVAEKNEKDIAYYTIQGDKEWLDECEKDCIEYAKEHRQLAEWLRELKAFHDAMDIIPTTPFNVDLGEIPINNRSYDDIVKCLMIAYERGKNDTLSLIEQYILGGKH